MPFTGSCSCGNIKFTVDSEPLKIALCHCLQCRRLTGTAYTTSILIPISTLDITSGTPRKSSFVQKSGITFDTTLCSDCGCVIGKATEDEAFKGMFILAAGLLDEDINKFKPDTELWVKHRANWITPVEGAVQAQTFS